MDDITHEWTATGIDYCPHCGCSHPIGDHPQSEEGDDEDEGTIPLEECSRAQYLIEVWLPRRQCWILASPWGRPDAEGLCERMTPTTTDLDSARAALVRYEQSYPQYRYRLVRQTTTVVREIVLAGWEEGNPDDHPYNPTDEA